MKYDLFKVRDEDRNIIYQIKKNSIYKYVDNIWGWNEDYQIDDFNKSFVPSNFNKIMQDKKCIGFIEMSESDDSINLTEIHIISDYQGQGIGSSVLKEIIYCGKTKNKKITLGCFKQNKSAVKLYKRLGFVLINETKTHYCFEI